MVRTWFFAYPRDQHAAARLELINQLNKRWVKIFDINLFLAYKVSV